MQNQRVDVLLIDEAAQAMEAELAITYHTRPRRCVFKSPDLMMAAEDQFLLLPSVACSTFDRLQPTM
jgi:hypothetical protein